MNRCPNCGWPNDEGNRFCENCGADLEHLRSSDDQRVLPDHSWPPPPSGTDSQGQISQDATETDPFGAWQMAPLPPQEAVKSKRRVWLWVLAVMMMLIIVFCVGASFWLFGTDSGERFQTEVAVRETEQADKEK